MPSLFDVSSGSPIHQILLTESGDIDRKPIEYIDNLRKKLTGPHNLWSDESIVELLASNFDKDVLEAYKSIKPLAYKADLARYCIIYTFGGWYSDLTVTVENVEILKAFDAEYEALLFRDMPIGRRLASVGNTIFWFKDPGSNLLSGLISSVVEKILDKDYSYHQHAVTGPLAFGDQVAKYQISNNSHSLLFGDTVLLSGKPSQIFNEIEFNDYQVFSHRRAMTEDVSSVMPSGYQSNSNYWSMYNNREVY